MATMLALALGIRINELVISATRQLFTTRRCRSSSDGMLTRTVWRRPYVRRSSTSCRISVMSVFVPVLDLAEWTKQNTPQILAAGAVYDARDGEDMTPPGPLCSG